MRSNNHVHYDQETQKAILINHGIHNSDAELIAKITSTFPFTMLDSLKAGINVISKGIKSGG